MESTELDCEHHGPGRFVDKNGKPVKAGDILKYDEGTDHSQSIHEVVEIDGKLCGVSRIGCPMWTVIENDEPIELIFYTLHSSGFRRPRTLPLVDAEVVGNVAESPELLSVAGAHQLWPI
ncbi:hypothetical protein [Rosistilla oblonga]|uniref:hypothetical protein n=1 Tax=Rosistilla oblonga TaxID=2527990 RepID=UPI003A985069